MKISIKFATRKWSNSFPIGIYDLDWSWRYGHHYVFIDEGYVQKQNEEYDDSHWESIDDDAGYIARPDSGSYR